jgi:hypothetical protein
MTSIIEKTDAYEVEASDLVVVACQLETSGLRLELQSPTVNWTLAIEGGYALEGRPMADLVGERVQGIRARKRDGQLKVKGGEGWVLTVETDRDYEAWQIYSTGGERLIAIPGGGVAVWTVAP